MATIFQKIIAREIPAEILYEDELCISIKDIQPQAPFHALIIPKKLIPRIGLAEESDQQTLGHLLLVAKKIAQEQHLDEGFRVVINNGNDGGETVPHLHVHLLGGRKLSWPPG
tara:strand:- start:371 stop:709 length:339 start_codon:yes stop_codon:yes gene_type:complete